MQFPETADGAGALQACKTYGPILVLMDKLLTDLIPAVAAVIGMAPAADTGAS